MIDHGDSKDILGRTYEYCLAKFAEQEGKLAGEFYTPSCVVRTLEMCIRDRKRPEMALKLFIRFALAKGVISYGLELMLAIFSIIQGVSSTIMSASGMGTATETVLPAEIVTAIEDCGFFESIPLWTVTLIGGL